MVSGSIQFVRSEKFRVVENELAGFLTELRQNRLNVESFGIVAVPKQRAWNVFSCKATGATREPEVPVFAASNIEAIASNLFPHLSSEERAAVEEIEIF